jgi:Zn-dependent M28 family amino/carboxypeptidase
MRLRRTASLLPVLCCLAIAPARGDTDAPAISESRMRAHIERLSSDEFAGRAPGSRGETLTVEYITAALREAGVAPGNPDGTYTQTVPMFGYTVTNAPVLAVRRAAGAAARTFAAGSEFVGWTLRQEAGARVDDAEMVFVGYGVVAPEYGWNDYKDADVRGKVVVMLVNDPPVADESLFGGRAMTYYGRWTYKFEQAAAAGAAGAILVHTAAGAGYGWEVVENSWSGEQFDVVRADRGASRCALESWVTEAAAREIFALAGRDLDAAVVAAAAREFQPVALGLRASAAVELRTRTLESRNVVGRVEGADAKRRHELVIYTAHWDHLGIGKPAEGDSIYNGALDNASGVAGVIEIARAFAAGANRPSRSVLFLFTTGEESGLLGSTHYAENPLYPLRDTVAVINVDGLNIWGRTTDIVVVGHGQSDLDETLARAAGAYRRGIVPDSEPEKGYYYRSDHFPFAKKGVPALYADSGIEFRDRPEGWGMERRRDYVAKRYHKPQDEYDPAWDLSGAAEDMGMLQRVGLAVADAQHAPQWRRTSEFRRAREEMLQGSD